MKLYFDDYLFVLVAAICLAILIKWHLDEHNRLSLLDLVCTDGKLNDKKFVRFGSWVVMTLGFYTLAMHHPAYLETYAPLYGALWVGSAALDKWQRQKETENVLPPK